MKSGKSLATKLHDKTKNIKDGKPTEKEKILIRSAMQSVEPGVMIRDVDYQKTPELEAAGWDLILRSGGQIKIRRPDFWNCRGKDFFIEERDGNRPNGLGWVYLYLNHDVRYFILLWRNPDTNSAPFIQVYDNFKDRFLLRCISEKRSGDCHPTPHPETGCDGVERLVSGYILPLERIKDILLWPIGKHPAIKDPDEWDDECPY